MSLAPRAFKSHQKRKLKHDKKRTYTKGEEHSRAKRTHGRHGKDGWRGLGVKVCLGWWMQTRRTPDSLCEPGCFVVRLSLRVSRTRSGDPRGDSPSLYAYANDKNDNVHSGSHAPLSGLFPSRPCLSCLTSSKWSPRPHPQARVKDQRTVVDA